MCVCVCSSPRPSYTQGVERPDLHQRGKSELDPGVLRPRPVHLHHLQVHSPDPIPFFSWRSFQFIAMPNVDSFVSVHGICESRFQSGFSLGHLPALLPCPFCTPPPPRHNHRHQLPPRRHRLTFLTIHFLLTQLSLLHISY